LFLPLFISTAFLNEGRKKIRIQFITIRIYSSNNNKQKSKEKNKQKQQQQQQQLKQQNKIRKLLLLALNGSLKIKQKN
jgi:hypothetical protein